MAQYTLRAKVWQVDGQGGWHFVTLPAALAARIRRIHGRERRGWGSLRVSVTVGRTRWSTSIFPDAKSKSYVLPLKAEVRRREGLNAGQVIRVMLRFGKNPAANTPSS